MSEGEATEAPAEKAADAARDPPKVELIIQDPAARKPGVVARLRGAFAIGLMGAGVFGAAGTVLGRKLVTWSETPSTLASCKEPVTIGVTNALDSLLLAQGITLGAGFLLLFVFGYSKLRGSPVLK